MFAVATVLVVWGGGVALGFVAVFDDVLPVVVVVVVLLPDEELPPIVAVLPDIAVVGAGVGVGV